MAALLAPLISREASSGLQHSQPVFIGFYRSLAEGPGLPCQGQTPV